MNTDPKKMKPPIDAEKHRCGSGQTKGRIVKKDKFPVPVQPIDYQNVISKEKTGLLLPDSGHTNVVPKENFVMHNDHANKIKSRPASFIREQSANAATEYAVCLSLLILVALGAIMSIGTGVEALSDMMIGALP